MNQVMPESMQAGDNWLRKIANKMREEKQAGAAPSLEEISVRAFIEKFGYMRRGQLIVSHIRKQLEDNGLQTLPDYEFEYIDNEICIALDGKEETPDIDTRSISRTAHVSSLKTANIKPRWVAPDDPIAKAITIMQCNDYSQLPVMTTERTVKGVVSWRSIARAYTHGYNPEFVRECMEGSPREVRLTSSFEELTRELLNHEHVLVRGKENEITGIVTATDLVDQFKELTLPFLFIGEIEVHLRSLVRGKFTTQQFSEATKDDKDIKGPNDLTFGDYCALFKQEHSWEKLGSYLDRNEFVGWLEEIRKIRNDVMHFSPDGVGSENLEKLKRFAEFLREYSISRT